MKRRTCLRTSAFALLLAACGKESAEPAGAPQTPAATTTEAAVTRAPARQARPVRLLNKLFRDRAVPLDEWDADNRRRLDPEYDGWPTEVAAVAAEKRLAALCERVWNAAGLDLLAFLSDDFQGATRLRPQQLEQLFDDGNVSVARPSSIDAALRPPGELALLIDELRAPFAGASVRASCAIVRIELGDARDFETDVLVQAFGASPALRVQQNLRWRIEWTDGDEPVDPPRIRALRLVGFEEVRAKRALFSDHTGRVLAGNACFEREYLLGIDDYYFKNDQLTGNAFIGNQGLAVGDVDGDGRDDLYVPMQGGIANRLFLHQADGTARDATPEARVAFADPSRSALIADMDGDGHRDLIVALASSVLIAFNEGQARFSAQVVLPWPRHEDVFSMAAADPDADGDLDLYCCRYDPSSSMMAAVPSPYHDSNFGAANTFWRNEGRRAFSDATAEVGLDHNNSRYSLAAVWEDFDDDGDLDLYVANDFGRNNLYRNDGGRFRDVAAECGAEDMAAGMGASVADFDLDGDMDLYVTNMFAAEGSRITRTRERFLGGQHRELHAAFVRHARGNTLLRNLGGGKFEDASETMGAAAAGWAWGGSFVDFGNDGYADLFVPNGFITGADATDAVSFFWRRVIGQSPAGATATDEYVKGWTSNRRMVMDSNLSWAGRQRDCAFLNLRGTSFADVSACAGLDFVEDGRAVALTDWDDDGRLDLIVKNRNAPRLRVLRNEDASERHWLAVDLVGTKSNRDAIGARVVVELEGRTLRQTLHAGDGYLSQSSQRLHFGLGDAQRARRLVVRWPNGATQSFDDLAADQRYRIVEGESAVTVVAAHTLDEFAKSAPSPVERLPGGVRRVPLVERLPMAAFPLPPLDGGTRTVADLAGAPLLVTLWGSWCTNCVDELAELERQRPMLEAAGLKLLTMTVDQGASLVAARSLLKQRGFEAGAGYADQHQLELIEVLLITLLGRSSDVPLPTSLLLDARGNLSVLYTGPLDFDVLLEDVRLLKELDLKRRNDRFFGGRWVARKHRDCALMAEVFQQMGASDLATFYASLGATDDDK